MIHSSIAGNISYDDSGMVICKLGNVQVGSDSLGKQTMLHAHVKLVLHSTRKGEQTSADTDTDEMVIHRRTRRAEQGNLTNLVKEPDTKTLLPP